MEALTKALDLLKASGWQAGMIAIAAGLFLFLSNAGVLPKLDANLVLVVLAFMFFCAALAAAALGSAAQQGASALFSHWQRRQALKDASEKFCKYIPFMTEHERQILGYLLKRKQKVFTADSDAGYGATLLGQGFIVIAAKPGQQVDYDKVPMRVPDYVWDVMEANPEKFTYEPEMSEGRNPVEVQPWRIPWQVR